MWFIPYIRQDGLPYVKGNIDKFHAKQYHEVLRVAETLGVLKASNAKNNYV